MAPTSTPTAQLALREGQVLARFPHRLAGVVYDSLIALALLLVAGFTYLPVTGGEAPVPGSWAAQGFRLYICAILFAFFVGFWVHGGRTLGMLAWQLRIVDASGAPPDLKRASLRFVLAVASWGTLGAGFLWALLDRENRAFHDRLAGTWLVREKSAS